MAQLITVFFFNLGFPEIMYSHLIYVTAVLKSHLFAWDNLLQSKYNAAVF
jgi:hypothetical protein